MFLATHAAAGVLSQNTQIQNSHGAKTLLLSPDQISARFPFLNTSNLHSGSFGLENEGWFDPYLLMTSFRKKAISQGVNYIQGKVVGFKQDPHNKNRVTKVYLERWDSSSNSLHKTEIGVKSFVVNSSGISGYLLSKLVDPKFDLPVRPRKRFIYVVSLKEPLPKNCPLVMKKRRKRKKRRRNVFIHLFIYSFFSTFSYIYIQVIDPTGIYFRPEGNNYICGMSPPEHEDPDCTDLVVNHDLFENTIWPILAERVPAFEHAKNTTAWAGHYDYNTFDQNAILGHHPTIPNFLLCNGFSGHGLQQSPAVGRALSELILHGKYCK